MGVRVRGPRLSLRDVEELMTAHTKLVALDRMLNGTNWAGALPAKILAGEVDVLIARLYNKAERAMTGAPEAPAAESEPSQPAEISPARDPDGARRPDPAALEEEKIQRCIHGLSVDQSCGLCRLGDT